MALSQAKPGQSYWKVHISNILLYTLALLGSLGELGALESQAGDAALGHTSQLSS